MKIFSKKISFNKILFADEFNAHPPEKMIFFEKFIFLNAVKFFESILHIFFALRMKYFF